MILIIAVIDYGCGNLFSLKNALDYIGADWKITGQTADIEAADWSLTPGRYVGVAPAEVDEDFDFEQTMRDIHTELADLNREAVELAARIQENFEGLGV